MQISDEHLEKFKEVYFKEFGEKLTRQEAFEKALRLINLIRVITRPRPWPPEKEEEGLPEELRLKDGQRRD